MKEMGQQGKEKEKKTPRQRKGGGEMKESCNASRKLSPLMLPFKQGVEGGKRKKKFFYKIGVELATQGFFFAPFNGSAHGRGEKGGGQNVYLERLCPCFISSFVRA